jgi:hypothetical protein
MSDIVAPVSAPAIARRPVRERTLWPREHGAWGQLLYPLVCGLVLGRGAPAAWLLVVAAAAVFLAHESALVLLGQRGPRLLESHGARARRWLLVLGSLAVAAGLVGLAMAPVAALVASVAAVALAVVVFALLARGLEKTTSGEIVAATALSSAVVPVALAGGAAASQTVAIFALWSLAYASATLSVRAVIARGKRRPWLVPAAVAPLVAVASAAVFAGPLGMSRLAWAFAPMGLFCAAVLLAPPKPRWLRAVGWALMVVCTVTFAVLLAVLLGSKPWA